MSIGQKLVMLKIQLTSIKLLSLDNLTAVPEETNATQEADQRLK